MTGETAVAEPSAALLPERDAGADAGPHIHTDAQVDAEQRQEDNQDGDNDDQEQRQEHDDKSDNSHSKDGIEPHAADKKKQRRQQQQQQQQTTPRIPPPSSNPQSPHIPPSQPPLPFVSPRHYLRRPRSTGDAGAITLGKDSHAIERPRSTVPGAFGAITEEDARRIKDDNQDNDDHDSSHDHDHDRHHQHPAKVGKGGIAWQLGREKDLARDRGGQVGDGGDMAAALSPIDSEQLEGLRIIRAFLKVRTSYDVLPLSFRLIVFDTALLVKKSLNILIQNGVFSFPSLSVQPVSLYYSCPSIWCPIANTPPGIVSAPLWDSKTSTFAGLLTVSDYINVIQYYVQNPDSLSTIDQFRLNSLRDIEKAIGVQPLETISSHPMQPLYTACRRMLESRARRIPLVDVDDETNRSMVVSVVTQYRILKFVAVNVKETQMLRKRLVDIRCVTSEGLQTARMETPVMDVIQTFVKYSISSVPILDDDGGFSFLLLLPLLFLPPLFPVTCHWQAFNR